MKTNKILGLAGVAALFATFAVACAAPAVQRSSGDESGNESSSKNDTSSSTPTTTTTAPTKPVTSTATTTGTTTTTADAGTTNAPAVNWCAKLTACSDSASVDPDIQSGWEIAAAIGSQNVCMGLYLTCKTNIFQTSCDELSDCCDEMGSNGNGALSNACRAKANAGDSNACSTQLDSYEGDGRCN